jgi:hypothetical protein
MKTEVHTGFMQSMLDITRERFERGNVEEP